MFQRYFTRQLRRPSGIVGRLFIGRWLNNANRVMNAEALRLLDLQKTDRFLEIGFGGGALLGSVLTSLDCDFVCGIELSLDMAASALRNLKSRSKSTSFFVACGDIAAMPFADGSFSAICTVNTLYFWKDACSALSECRRVLKNHGRIVICFNSKADMESWPPHRFGFRLYEAAEVKELLAGCGFRDVEVTEFKDRDQGVFFCAMARVDGK